MKIKEIEIHGFRVLQECQVTFQLDGLNVLVGPNESGKSTLCQAIAAVLYGSSEPIESLRTWDSEDDPWGKLVLALEEGELHVERNLATHIACLTLYHGDSSEELFNGKANPRGRTEEANRYRELLAKLNLPPESIFRSSGYIGQMSLQIVLRDDLRKQLSGAGQGDYLQVMDDLQKKYYEITREPLPGDRAKTSDKKLEQLIASIASRMTELEQAKNIQEMLILASQKLGAVQALLDLSEKKLNDLTARAIDLEKLMNLLSKSKDLNDQMHLQMNQLDSLQSLQGEIERINRELQSERFQKIALLSDIGLTKLERFVQSDTENLLQKIQQLSKEVQEIQSELTSTRFVGFDHAPENTPQLLDTLIQEKRRLDDLKPHLAVASEATNQQVAGSSIPWMALGIVVGAIIGGLLVRSQPLLGAVILGGLAGAITLFIISRRKGANQLKLQQATTRLQTEYDAAEVRFKDAENALIALLKGNEESISYDALRERWTEYAKKKNNLNELNIQLKALQSQEVVELRDDPEIASVINSAPAAILKESLQDYRQLKADSASKQNTLSQMSSGAISRTPIDSTLDSRLRQNQLSVGALVEKYPTFSLYILDLEKGLKTLEDLNKEKEKITDQESNLRKDEKELEFNKRSLEQKLQRNPLMIEEELEELKDELHRLQLRKDALSLAIQILQEATEEYEYKHMDYLSEKTTKYFQLFTGDRYEKVTVRVDCDPMIKTCLGQEIGPDVLSQGARDQLYLALRLSILDLLSDGISLPIILDDTFVNFDDQRLSIAHDTVDKLAQTRQVLILSHNLLYLDWEGKKIELDN